MSVKRVSRFRLLQRPLVMACLVAAIGLPGKVQAQPKPSSPASSAQPPAANPPPGNQPATPPARFEIDDFRVDGNTVLSEEAIDAALLDFVGPDRTIDDVQKARASLEA